MEFEDVEAKIEWEARRVGAAFGAPRESCETGFPLRVRFDSYSLSAFFTKQGERETIEINIFDEKEWCSLWHRETWLLQMTNHAHFNDLMARGLYCLGFTEESVISQLPQLSNHEKLELRLSLPREFWPKAWLDEEGVKKQASSGF